MCRTRCIPPTSAQVRDGGGAPQASRPLPPAAAAGQRAGAGARGVPTLARHATLFAALMMALMIVWATLGHRFANSTRFAGEGSAACLLGLVVGAVLLVARPLFHPEVLQSMLSFDAANFFV